MPSFIYNPDSMPREELREAVVGRDFVKNEILSLLKQGRSVVVAGQRGLGKTTLLLLVKEAVEAGLMRTSFDVVKLPEELYGVGTMEELWSEIRGRMGVAAECSNPRKLLLLIDNLEMLADQLSGETEAFKSLVCGEADTLVVATTTLDENTFFARNRALGSCLEWVRLSRLEENQVCELLTKRAEIDGNTNYAELLKTQAHKAKTLVYFTAGIPRLALLLYRVTAHSDVITVQENLRRLIDEATPYYKHRIEALTIQQRRILDHIARRSATSGRAVTPGEISVATKLSPNLVSSQLKRLAEQGYVERVHAAGRNTFFSLAEPLFSIWYQMRFSKEAGDRLRWLVEFLGNWYSTHEVEIVSDELASSFRLHLDQGRYDDARNALEFRQLLIEAFGSSPSFIAEKKQQLLRDVADFSRLTSQLSESPDKDSREGLGTGDFGSSAAGRRPKRSELEETVRFLLVDAARARRRQDFDASIALYSSALEIESNCVPALLGRGDTYRAKRLEVEALQDYRMAADVTPRTRADKAAKATAHRRLGEIERAVSAFRELIEEEATDYRAWVNLGRCLIDASDHGAAVEAFERATTLRPTSSLAFELKAKALAAAQRHSEAASAFGEAIARKPSDKRLGILRATALVNAGDLETALALIRELDSRWPKDPQVLAHQGWIELQRDNTRVAIELLRKADSVEGNDTFPRLLLGLALSMAGEHKEAVQCLGPNISETSSPDLAEFLLGSLQSLGEHQEVLRRIEAFREQGTRDELADWHAQSLFALNRASEALAVLDEAIAKDPGNTSAWAALASIHSQQNDPASVLRVLNEALTQNPDALALRRLLISQLKDSDRIDEALVASEMALKSPAAGSHDRAAHAGLLLRAEKLRASIALAKQVLVEDPRETEAWRVIAAGFGIQGKLRRVLETVDEGLKHVPEEAELYRLKGMALLQLERLEESESVFAKAISLEPDWADLWRQRGIVVMQQGRVDEARPLFRRAMELEPDNPDILLQAATLERVAGDSEAGIRLLEEARIAAEGSPAASLRIALAKVGAIGDDEALQGISELRRLVEELPNEGWFDPMMRGMYGLAKQGRHRLVEALIDQIGLAEELLPLNKALEVIRTGDKGLAATLTPETRKLTLSLVKDLSPKARPGKSRPQRLAEGRFSK